MSLEIPTALTFDDILLVPAYSEVLPSEVSTESLFAKDLYLKAPIISSAMDTVTENHMARVMAQMGGFGVIHKNMNAEAQASEVEKVKKYESGMIMDPITIGPDEPVEAALALMEKYGIGGIPITVDGKLVGMLTNRDVRYLENTQQAIANLMTKDSLITAKEGVRFDDAKSVLHQHRIEKLPIVDENNYLKGLITIKDIEKKHNYPNATKDSSGRLIAAAACGAGEKEYERLEALVAAGVDILVVDTAHGHSKNVVEIVKYAASKYPDLIIVAGNVGTEEASDLLFQSGADVVKVGIGPGSICTTRVVCGVGVPQVTAIQNAAKAAAKCGKKIIADGGIQYSGDIVKAMALGADAVMMGSLFAGTSESPGDLFLYQGRTYKAYRGMGSLAAMKKGSKDRYAQEDVSSADKFVPEGIEGRVAFKGSCEQVMHQMIGGLRSGMGYLGAANLSELRAKAHFIRLTQQGLRESHVHDVKITQEAPNYQTNT
tara:strand:+ start:4564 stop:6027 length:1464 start_codon:yes stop_codon:yes gene_type:complete